MTVVSVPAARADLKVTFTTSPTPFERYAPRNVVAVWIEDSNGGFVKTLMRYGSRRVGYLRAWMATNQDSNQLSTAPDVITGATRSSHGTLTATWNLEDFRGNPVPDGAYTIRMELTDHNSSSTSANNEARFVSNITGANSQQTNLSDGGFNNVGIVYSSPGGGGGGGGVTDPSCTGVSFCIDNDGCCLPDCVYEVDSDCSPDSARDPGGCSAGGTGHGAAPIALIALAWLAASRRRRTRRAA